MSIRVRSDPPDGARRHSGDDVADWLRTDEARAAAGAVLRRRRLPRDADMVDDLLAAATLAVLTRLASPSADELVVANPAAYGTTVIRNTLARQLRGADVLAGPAERIAAAEALVETVADADTAPDAPTAGDAARLAIETVGSRDPWVVAAALGYLTYTMHSDAVPDGLPSPRAGADPEHALAWSVLWLAGERSVFPRTDGSDPKRRTRARRIAAVLDHLAVAFARLRRDGLDV